MPALTIPNNLDPLFQLSADGNLYYATSQAAQAVTVALNTTYTGLCLSNPASNSREVVVWAVGMALTVAPAAISALGIQGGWTAAGVVTHTTPLVWGTAMGHVQQGYGGLTLGAGNAPSALADAACTTVGPKLLMPLVSGFTAAALPSHTPIFHYLRGGIILQPGGWVAIYALTAVTGLWSFWWSERVRSQ